MFFFKITQNSPTKKKTYAVRRFLFIGNPYGVKKRRYPVWNWLLIENAYGVNNG